jgi:hypothetical protein
MTNEQVQLVRQIINEELSNLSLEPPVAEEEIPGTIVVASNGKELPPPSSVEPIEPDGEYMEPDFDGNIDDLVAHKDFVPADDTEQYQGVNDLSRIVGERLSVANRQRLFKLSHEAKMRVKELREGNQELSSLRHAIVSEYIEGLSSYIDTLTRYERLVKEQLGSIAKESNYRASTLLSSVASNVSVQMSYLSENDTDEKLQDYLAEVVMPFIRFLTKIEADTRFDLN